MTLITAIIEKAQDGGYGIYARNVDGAYGSGLTEEEARENFLDVLEEQAEYYKEKKGVWPEWHCGCEVEFRYDLSGFFQSFPFFNVSRFARSVGINPSLMRRYKEGLAFAGEKQKMIIQNRFSEIVERMSAVKF
jgi:predicted RNase H-like HicB family nuclease